MLFEVILGICYSVRPMSFKDRFLAKTLTIGAGGVSSSILGGAASGHVTPGLLFTAAMFFVFLFATSPINDLADYAGDIANKRRTIPIVIGPSKTVKLAIAASITPLFSYFLFSGLLVINLLSVVLLLLFTGRCLQLLIPLARADVDPHDVRRNHKKMVPLHLLLQGALAAGFLLV